MFHTFKQIQNQLGLPQHILFQDVSTRWNSSFYMLQRLLEQKRAISVASTECTSAPTAIRVQQWTLAEKEVKVLVVFDEATREAGGDYASCAIITPIINTLKLALLRDEKDQGIMTMKRAMMKSLEDRYSKVEENPLCAIVTVLDPRFKQRVFFDQLEKLLMLECLSLQSVRKLYQVYLIQKRNRLQNVPELSLINHPLLFGTFLMT